MSDTEDTLVMLKPGRDTIHHTDSNGVRLCRGQTQEADNMITISRSAVCDNAEVCAKCNRLNGKRDYRTVEEIASSIRKKLDMEEAGTGEWLAKEALSEIDRILEERQARQTALTEETDE